MVDETEVVVPEVAAPETPAPAGAPEAAKAAPAAEETVSTWQKLTKGIRSMSDDVDAESAKAAAKDGEADAEGDTEKEPVKPAAEKAGEVPAKAPAGPARYTVRDAEGEIPDGIEWPKGVTVAFKADGRPVHVESMDALVDFAQKGVFADRKIGEAVRDRIQAQREAQEQTTTHRQQLKDAQDILLDAVFDDAVREKLAEALDDLRDPNARKVKALEAEAAAKVTAEQQRAASEQAEKERAAIGTFWEAVDSEIDKALPDYPNLDAGDTDRVIADFVALYDQDVAQLVAFHQQQGQTPPQARALAERQAARVYTEPNLKAVMQRLNDRLEAKIGPHRTAAQIAKAKADAAAHNAHVDEKVHQRDSARPIRGSGAPPAAARAAPVTEGKGNAFQRMQRGMRAELSVLDEE